MSLDYSKWDKLVKEQESSEDDDCIPIGLTKRIKNQNEEEGILISVPWNTFCGN